MRLPSNRILLSLIALFCVSVVGIALYLQHVHYLLPCPLCIIQRYAYLGTALFCLIGAAQGHRAWTGLALACTLGGLGTVGWHLWVIAHPGRSCGIDPTETLLNNLPTATYLPYVFEALGACEAAEDRMFGLNIPQWSGVGFLILAAALLFLLLRRR
jgi:disulfide bond formation protein DsbB